MRLMLATCLLAVACGGGGGGGGDDDDTVDAPTGGGGDICDGKPFKGSCRRNDNQGCIDTYGAAIDPAMVEADCNGSGNSTFSSNTCATTNTVGGCERDNVATCSVTWLYPPATTPIAMQGCSGGRFIAP